LKAFTRYADRSYAPCGRCKGRASTCLSQRQGRQ
jgi:hypothetical protein